MKRFRKWRAKDIMEHKARLKPWEKDYILGDLGPRGIFYEYLEMCKYIMVVPFVGCCPSQE
jgi:hypothetical protein